LQLGAVGIQVGTDFAFCKESGLSPDLKQQAIALVRAGKARVFTDPRASPAGFPFKVLQMKGTLSENDLYAARPRICDLGYLLHLYRKCKPSALILSSSGTSRGPYTGSPIELRCIVPRGGALCPPAATLKKR
ncbi:hypothetical protein ACFLQL_02525, partial [Verrucomicrobiota bacterium]